MKGLNKKGYLQISFSWIFAIIVGGFIIFLAIYGVNKLSDSQSETSDIILSKEIGLLLDPLETGFEESISSSFSIPKKSKLYFICEEQGNFGKQKIILRSENFDKYSSNDLEIELESKYIFAEKILEGKSFNLFSKVFSFPFKTATLVYVTPSDEKYCFMDTPSNIEEELESLQTPNRKYLFTEDCPEDSIRVCFGREGCEISVKYRAGEITKEGEIFYFYEDALMYAAIFSDKENYDCQLKRLMKKVGILSDLYIQKARINPSTGCSQNAASLNEKLVQLKIFTENFESPVQIERSIVSLIEDMENKNKNLDCGIW